MTRGRPCAARQLRQALLCLSLLWVVPSPSVAQDEPAPEPTVESVAALFTEYVRVRDGGPAVPTGAKRVELEARSKREFLRAFERTDLAAWDVASHQELFVTGCEELLDDARAAKDPAEIVRILEAYLPHVQDELSIAVYRDQLYPRALFETADPASAIPRYEALLEHVPAHDRFELVAQIAKLHAAAGDYSAARSQFARARELKKQFPSPRRAPHRDLPGIELVDFNETHRLRLKRLSHRVGAPPDEFVALKTLGQPRKALVRKPTEVVVLDVFQLLDSPTCRAEERLNDHVRALKKLKVRVVGVTWFPKSSLSGPRKLIMPGRTERTVEVTADDFGKALARWKRAAKVTYPIVLVEDPTARSGFSANLTGVHLVDREGTVAYYAEEYADHAELVPAAKIVVSRSK